MQKTPPALPTIAALGTMTRDTTVYADGSRSENLGGLLYTLLTLTHLFEGRARILPVANVGEDALADVGAALDLPAIDLSALQKVPAPNNHVYLTYSGPEARDEVLRGLVPPVDLAHCLAARDADWFLVNLTSGRDIELETLESFRSHYRGILQLDVHSLTLGFAPGGRRVLRRPARWERWLACADWVQMNATEAELLGGGEAAARFASRVLDLGPRGALVTLGPRGCVAVWRQDGVERHVELDAAHHPDPPFPTGCGDVFGASFAYACISGLDVAAAVELANAIASTKACFEPCLELRHLRRHAAAHLARVQPG